MTIHPRPDQEQKIQEAIQAGLVRSAEEIVDAGLESLRERQMKQPADAGSTQKSLVELFAPLRNFNLDFSRNRAIGRPVNL